jgi:hypothetical protein
MLILYVNPCLKTFLIHAAFTHARRSFVCVYLFLCRQNVPRNVFKTSKDLLRLQWSSRLGGVVVSVLATGPKVRGFKPGRGDGFLSAIKIRSTTSFGLEVKREGPK